jgi:hypothetical protein
MPQVDLQELATICGLTFVPRFVIFVTSEAVQSKGEGEGEAAQHRRASWKQVKSS